MAIPSGSGTEVLKYVCSTGGSVQTRTVFTVPTDHIYTLLNIHVAENGNAKAQGQVPTGSFFRERGEYRKAG